MCKVYTWKDIGIYLLNAVVGLITLIGLLAFLGAISRLVSIAFIWGWMLLK